jgi:predicted HD superfamily hydrolase involved in NAD metabolism
LNKLLLDLIGGIMITGDIEKDVYRIFQEHNCQGVAEHTKIVANAARQIAKRFGLNEESAFIAGMLHDIGNIVPKEDRVNFCNEFGIEVLDVEKVAPALLHSKISKIIAKGVFEVDDEVCNAIACHSTLKANTEKLDLTLFVADKLSWDSKHNMEFIEEMLKGLEVSLEHAAFAFIKYLCKSQVEVMHPKTIEAFNYLEGICK